jgi:hypothetical protein
VRAGIVPRLCYISDNCGRIVSHKRNFIFGLPALLDSIKLAP